MALLILSLVLSFGLLQSPQSADTPRPVRDVTTPTSVDELDMSFSFEEPGIYHVMRAHFSAIDGDPVAGGRYGVHAMVGGRFLTAVRFELIGEDGSLIGPVPMLVDDSWGTPRLVGMVTAPDRPFRVRLVGMTAEGKRLQAIYQKLFRPGRPRRLQPMPAPPGLPPQMVEQMAALFPTLLAEATAAREALIKGVDPQAMMRLPRVRVTNVQFAPYRSPSGRTLGLQVFYDGEFARTGLGSAGVVAEQVYAGVDPSWRRELPGLTVAVTPAPYLADNPSQPASFSDDHRGARLAYKEGTRYSFRMLLVPGFVERHGQQRTLCILKSRFKEEGELARMLAVRGEAPYRVRIADDTFEGMIDAFDSEGVLYQNWLDEGTPPCPTYDGGH
jgi:hypothetical protein